MDALDRVGKALRKTGSSLEELIKSGRETRGEMVEADYGLETVAGD
jgi:hypothetical protein